MTPQQRKKIDLVLARFTDAMTAWNWSPRTIECYGEDLRAFARWLASETAVTTLAEVQPETLSAYQIALLTHPKRDGLPLAVTTQARRLSVVRSFFRYLAAEGLLLTNPAAQLRLPKTHRRLPQALLTPKETLRLLESVDTSTPLGLRDRAILEVLYSTGMRNSELRALTVADFDPEAGTLAIRKGKGGKDRIVPLGPVPSEIVSDYITHARPTLLGKGTDAHLFVSWTGRPLHRNDLAEIVTRAAERAGIKKPIRPHRLRHACATHMLNGGADIRHIQTLLGHAALSTTQIYTHVAIADLKAVHRKFHPREKGRR